MSRTIIVGRMAGKSALVADEYRKWLENTGGSQMKVTIDTDDYVKELKKQLKQKLNADEIELSPQVNKLLDSILASFDDDAAEMKPEVFAQHLIEHGVKGTLDDFWDFASLFFAAASKSDKSDRS